MSRTARTTLVLGTLTAVALGMTACAGPSAAATPSGDAVRTVTVATGGSPKPYTFLGDDNKPTGYDIEILQKIDEKLPQYAFQFEVADFPALFAGLDSGRYDIVANNLSATEERKKKYDFSDPYLQAQFGVGVSPKSGITKVDDLAELAGKKTFGEPGLNFTKILEKYNTEHPDKQIAIEYTELDLQSQYKAVAAGTADFVFSERVVFDGYGKDQNLGLSFVPIDGKYLESTFGTSLYSAYAISKHAKDEAELKKAIDGALAELKKDGELKKLSDKYFGTDLTPQS